MPFLHVDHGEIHHEDHGSGYPVLLFAPGSLSSRIERRRTNPARPGVPQDWLDPIAALSSRFRLIALDVRNAGRSRASIAPGDDTMHPAETSAEFARAPRVEIVAPWKGAARRDEAMRRVRDFLVAHH